MSEINAQLKRQIMRRVYIVAFARKFLRPFVMKSFFLSLFIVLGFSFVSVTNVIKNALHGGSNFSEITAFLVRAFFQTEFFVQFLFVGIVFLIGWLSIDTARDFKFKAGHVTA